MRVTMAGPTLQDFVRAYREERGMPYDARYDFSVCSKCGREWQNLDYGCAAHQLSCGYPLPPKVEQEQPREVPYACNNALCQLTGDHIESCRKEHGRG